MEGDSMQPHIRWMIRKDMPQVLGIENEGFEYPWREIDFIRVLRKKTCIGLTAEVGGSVGGFVFYELHKNRLAIHNLAVAPDLWRRGIGTALVKKLLVKLSANRRDRITMGVGERNLRGHLFLRSLGFRCVGILPEYYEANDETAYCFEHRLAIPARVAAGVFVKSQRR
jgi:ribosomal-protein-alanine N-acetyltransferase